MRTCHIEQRPCFEPYFTLFQDPVSAHLKFLVLELSHNTLPERDWPTQDNWALAGGGHLSWTELLFALRFSS